MVLLVKIYVGAERRRAGGGHYEEQIDRKDKKHPACDEKCRDQKVGGVVSFVTTMSRRDQVSLGIVCMVKSEVVPVEDAAYPVMAKNVMEQGLTARYDQMGADGTYNIQRKHRQEPSRAFDHQQRASADRLARIDMLWPVSDRGDVLAN
jgi:hypothetical protein